MGFLKFIGYFMGTFVSTSTAVIGGICVCGVYEQMQKNNEEIKRKTEAIEKQTEAIEKQTEETESLKWHTIEQNALIRAASVHCTVYPCTDLKRVAEDHSRNMLALKKKRI